MNKHKRAAYGHKVIAILLMVMMMIGCIPSIATGVYAEGDNAVKVEDQNNVSDPGTTPGTETPDPEEPVVPEKIKLDITITGQQVSAEFDGNEQTAQGYESAVPADQEINFDPNKIVFTGTDSVSGRLPGKYPMGLTEDMFSYVDPENPDGYEVTFTVTDGGLTITGPAAPDNLYYKAGFQRVKLWWPKATSKAGKVFYEVRTGNKPGDKVVKTGLTTTELDKIPFDPYPGNQWGRGTDATARKAKFAVYTYVLDPADKTTKIYSDQPVMKDKIAVIHPMYVVITAQKNGVKLYTSSTGSKYNGTAKKGWSYIGVGGSRVKGENKRILIKVKGQWRYMRCDPNGPRDVKITKMVYYSKNNARYSKAAIEAMINDHFGYRSHGKLIWVNTYNQRVFLMTWSGGKWVIDKRYPGGILANTGKELTPYGTAEVSSFMKRKEKTGTRWWTIFRAVGIHQKLSDALGKPASGGCVRIPTSDARWFYYNIKKGTTVFVY